MCVDCLFDTNAIVKRYHTESGTDVIDYLIDKSPSATINLLNIQVAETIKTFYNLRARGIFKSDEIRDTLIDTFLKDIYDASSRGKVRLYDFANEHLKDMAVYGPVMKIPRPTHKLQQFAGKKKERADTIDVLMLAAMREIHLLTEESYLVTSDEHVLAIAKHFGLRTIDPEKTTIDRLPESLDVRQHKRNKIQIKVICRDSVNNDPLGSTTSIDLCESGVRVRFLDSLTHERRVSLKLSPLRSGDPTIETSGEVCWAKKPNNGIRFTSPIPSDQYFRLLKN